MIWEPSVAMRVLGVGFVAGEGEGVGYGRPVGAMVLQGGPHLIQPLAPQSVPPRRRQRHLLQIGCESFKF
jgi:hypothetical protein